MKMHHFGVLAVLILSATAVQILQEKSEELPEEISTLLTLLGGLRDEVKAEHEERIQFCDKNGCTCAENQKKMSVDIASLTEEIEEDTHRILELETEIATGKGQIKQYGDDVADNEESTKQAIAAYDTYKDRYHEEDENIINAIGALKTAIPILKNAGQLPDKPGFLQSSHGDAKKAASAIQNALAMSSLSVHATKEDLQQLQYFVAHPEEFELGQASLVQKNNPFGDYAPQSGRIVGILGNMQDEMEKDKKNADAEFVEKTAAHNHLLNAKRVELESLKAGKASREAELATDEKDRADRMRNKKDNLVQTKATQESLAVEKKSCINTAQSCSRKSRDLTVEMHGCQEAMRIIEESSETLETAFQHRKAAFLQISSHQGVKSSTHLIAADQPNAMCAVKKKIDKMIALLREEDKDDIGSRDACLGNQKDNANTLEHLDKENLKLTQTHESLSEKKEVAETKLKAQNGQEEDLKNEMEDAKDAFIADTALHRQELNAIQNAINVLVMAKGKLVNMTKEIGAKSSFTSIISVFDMLMEDFEKQKSTALKDHAKDMASYKEVLKANNDQMDSIKESIIALNEQIASIDEKSARVATDQAQNTEESNTADKMKAGLEKDCVWIKTHFNTRKEAREQEVNSLIQAKQYLADITKC